MASRPPPEFHITVTFRAPMDFVFRWCTDYRPDDAALEGEKFPRRILSRRAGRVVFEDLESVDEGWAWKRYTVDLRPPGHWDAGSVGNRRHLSLEYDLSDAGSGRTRLDLRWRRRTGLVPMRFAPKPEVERNSRLGWRRLAVALERDYRRTSDRTRSGRRGSRTARPGGRVAGRGAGSRTSQV